MLGREYRWKVFDWIWCLVEDIRAFEVFPWGTYIYSVTIYWLGKALNDRRNMRKQNINYSTEQDLGYQCVWISMGIDVLGNGGHPGFDWFGWKTEKGEKGAWISVIDEMLRRGFKSTIGDSIRLRLSDPSCTSMGGMTQRMRQIDLEDKLLADLVHVLVPPVPVATQPTWSVRYTPTTFAGYTRSYAESLMRRCDMEETVSSSLMMSRLMRRRARSRLRMSKRLRMSRLMRIKTLTTRMMKSSRS
ncbi:hypothetical protein LWI28_007860 [Acer negundo]|uniref:Uncharacterized protein n=1 Tax=Acer negundo TaxID=4023 RepID=A0AAD5JDN6_ACENE|nr:hypothetical protein LWI28_007860 [Acer negundo]